MSMPRRADGKPNWPEFFESGAEVDEKVVREAMNSYRELHRLMTDFCGAALEHNKRRMRELHDRIRDWGGAEKGENSEERP